jgi:translation initiation factor 2B subunit (eIF-2B alpha/beta/delta family)
LDKKDEPRDQVRALISEIASDNRGGAAEILSRAAQALGLLEETKAGLFADVESALGEIIETCSALARAQPRMSPILNLAGEAVEAALKAKSAGEALRTAADAARTFIARARRAADLAASRAADLLGDGATALTHSRSSTVVAAITKALRAGKRIKVIATESRPVLEGRALAEALSSEGASVALIADAAAALAIEQADLIIVGADCVTAENVINKIGTRMIALAARERARPVYALSDTSKFICYLPPVDEQRAGEELWPGAPREVAVMNRYFEPTPLEYFTAVVTEGGLLGPEEASRAAMSIKPHEALAVAPGKTRPRAVDKAQPSQ